jgi:hypothetical protein
MRDRYLVAGGLSGVNPALEILEFDQTVAHAAEICISVKLSNDHDETPNVRAELALAPCRLYSG